MNRPDRGCSGGVNGLSFFGLHVRHFVSLREGVDGTGFLPSAIPSESIVSMAGGPKSQLKPGKIELVQPGAPDTGSFLALPSVRPLMESRGS